MSVKHCLACGRFKHFIIICLAMNLFCLSTISHRQIFQLQPAKKFCRRKFNVQPGYCTSTINYKIEHIAGKTNIADMLSGLPLMELDATTSGHVVDSYVRFIVEYIDLERAMSIWEIRTETAQDKTL